MDQKNSYDSFTQQQLVENFMNKQYMMAVLDPSFYYSIPAFQELTQHGYVSYNNDNNNNNHNTRNIEQQNRPVASSPPVRVYEEQELTSSSSGSPSLSSAIDFKLICENCGRSLTSRKRYQNHYTKCVEKSMNPKIFGCTYCKCEFRVKKTLLKHIGELHSEELARDERMINVNLGNSPPDEQIKKTSIFHSIDMMAVSDCKQKN